MPMPMHHRLLAASANGAFAMRSKPRCPMSSCSERKTRCAWPPRRPRTWWQASLSRLRHSSLRCAPSSAKRWIWSRSPTACAFPTRAPRVRAARRAGRAKVARNPALQARAVAVAVAAAVVAQEWAPQAWAAWAWEQALASAFTMETMARPHHEHLPCQVEPQATGTPARLPSEHDTRQKQPGLRGTRWHPAGLACRAAAACLPVLPHQFLSDHHHITAAAWPLPAANQTPPTCRQRPCLSNAARPAAAHAPAGPKSTAPRCRTTPHGPAR